MSTKSIHEMPLHRSYDDLSPEQDLQKTMEKFAEHYGELTSFCLFSVYTASDGRQAFARASRGTTFERFMINIKDQVRQELEQQMKEEEENG